MLGIDVMAKKKKKKMEKDVRTLFLGRNLFRSQRFSSLAFIGVPDKFLAA